jgi:hypothetical protein
MMQPRVMQLAPHPHSTAADLLRLLAGWLVVILLVQGFAAAQALGLGPLHRHDPGRSGTVVAHQHDGAERHHHVLADASVRSAAGEADLDLDAFALAAALALLAFATLRTSSEQRLHVRRPARTWAWRVFVPALPTRPPSTGA